jgi:transposase
LDIPKSTVSEVIKKYNKVGLIITASHSGRPKVLSERDSRHLVKIAKENRSNTLEEITENFNTSMAISVSTRTVQKILHKEGYSRHAAKKTFCFRKKSQKIIWMVAYAKNCFTKWDHII